MWYKINWKSLIVQKIQSVLRNEIVLTLMQISIVPLETLYFVWIEWREENLYKLKHNGQVCYLRKSLNDKFDPDLRRIYIGKGQIYNTAYIYTEAEEQNVYIHTEGEEPTLWLRTEIETADTGFDFIVFVPEEVYNAQIFEVEAHINLYKAGGRRHSILKINE